MSSSFDFQSMVKYKNNFEKMAKNFDAWIKSFLLTEGMRFITEVKKRTPVDTGDLRNHWRLAGMTKNGDLLKCWFVNPMNYATFVEYGHAKPYKSGAQEGSDDWVEGYFMMTISLDFIERNMPRRFDNGLDTFLRFLGVL